MSELIRVAYVSVRSPTFRADAVSSMLEPIRKKNAALDVSGLLIHVDGSFFQILEGQPAALGALYQRIALDGRHQKVLKLIEEPIERRDFSAWSMALADVTRKTLSAVPGLSDYFLSNATLNDLGPGRARTLLAAFREGRWRASLR